MPLTVGQNRTNAFRIATDYATFMGGGCKPGTMVEAGQQVFMPSVIDKEGVTTPLGITTKEEDSWAVLRAFFARASRAAPELRAGALCARGGESLRCALRGGVSRCPPSARGVSPRSACRARLRRRAVASL